MATALESLAPPLDWIAGGLEESGWAAELCDAEWRLVRDAGTIAVTRIR